MPRVPGGSGRDAVELGFEVALAFQADDLVGDLAVLEDEERRNGAHAVLGGQFLGLIDVDLANFDPPVVFAGQFIDRAQSGFARKMAGGY